MSAVASEQSQVDPADSRAAHRLRSRQPVVWVALAASALAVVAGGWWLTHPKVFLESSTFEATMNLPTGDVHAVAFAVIDPSVESHDTVTFRHVEPVVVRNDAGARLELRICRLDPDRPDGSVVGSIDVATLSEFCKQLDPVDGARFDRAWDARPQSQVILTITPTRPGVVKIQGLNVSYRQGIRFGNQTTGPDLTVTSTEGAGQ